MGSKGIWVFFIVVWEGVERDDGDAVAVVVLDGVLRGANRVFVVRPGRARRVADRVLRVVVAHHADSHILA